MPGNARYVAHLSNSGTEAIEAALKHAYKVHLDLVRRHHNNLRARLTRWSRLPDEEIGTLLAKLEDRADALGLQFRSQELAAKLMDLTTLATSMAMEFAYTGRLTG